MSNILRGGSTHQNKKKKKSNKHASRKVNFLRSVHLYIVADDVWLWVPLRDRQGKHRGNKHCMGRVVAKVQRDALLWTIVMLSTSYNKCHEWTSDWTSPMKKCRATGRRKHAFPDPCAILFSVLWYVLLRLTIFVTLVFSHYGQMYISQKVCISGPMCNNLFSCCGMYYHLSQYWTLLFSATMNKCIELRKYAFPDTCLLEFFLVLVGTTTSQNIRHFLTSCIIQLFRLWNHQI